MQQQKSLRGYFNSNKNNYSKLSIELALKELLKNYTKDNPEVLKPVKNIVIAVKSVDEVLKNINFDWQSDLINGRKINFFMNDNIVSNLIDFYTINILSSIDNILEFRELFIEETLKNTGFFKNDLVNIKNI